MTLQEYRRKRDFSRTPEPRTRRLPPGRRFVVQKHAARRLHYDFRLELDGVLKSWAVPKGPSLDPAERRLAIQVEDHPLAYFDFEGAIPAGEYGAGTVIVWDQGSWEADDDLAAGFRKGKLKFRLAGSKLQGGWTLVRMRGRDNSGKEWLLIKERDEHARPLAEFDVLEESPLSVLSDRSLQQVAAAPRQEWTSGSKQKARSAHNGAASRVAARPRKSASPPRRSPARLKGARKAKLPKRVDVQLARLQSAAPAGDDWLHEIKFDGYRLIARIEKGQVSLWTRNHQDWTERFPELAHTLSALPVKSAILDGEVVALSPDGVSDFQALQNSFRKHQSDQLIYYAFDLLYLDGADLRGVALEDRKQLLGDLLKSVESARVQFSDHLEGSGPEFLRECCERGLEGIVSKRRDRPSRAGRSDEWIKTKCQQREEFVIGGFTDPAGSRIGFGALLVGDYDAGGKLRYAGRVGTGFSHDLLRELRSTLDRLERKDCPFADFPERRRKGIHWVKPALVAQVAFGNWTEDGLLRHPSFLGLREDKRAREIVRDRPEESSGTPRSLTTAAKSRKAKSRSAKAASARSRRSKQEKAVHTTTLDPAQLDELAHVRLSNPEKILFPEMGLTKLELASYYVSIADWILPHIVDRPVSLVRCPEGESGSCFYQKHARAGTPEAIDRVRIQEKNKSADYLVVRNLAGLASLVQIGVLEIHPWGARTNRLERPDRMIFDLDPDEGLPWERTVSAAWKLHDLLHDLGLESFLKTSGGKGLHIVAPLVRRHTWDDVKEFSQAVAVRLARQEPDKYTATMSKSSRRGKVYIDYQRNNRGATSVAPYSTRAKPGATVSVPLHWDELTTKIKSDTFHIGNVRERLASLESDPWAEIDQLRQSITADMRRRLNLKS